MKILAKLLTGFIAVALLCGIVGVVGISQISTLNKAITQISTETIPTLDTLNVIDTDLTNLKVAIRTIVNPYGIDDDVFYQRQLANVETYRAGYKAAREKFEAISMVPEEERLYNVVRPMYDKAVEYNNAILAKVAKARSAGPDERAAIFQDLYIMISGEQRLAYDNLQAELRKVLAYDQKYYGVDLPKQAMAAAAVGIAILIIVTVLAFGVAIALGLLLGTSISKALKKAVAVLDKIAVGDLSERMESKTKDEFLQVATSLNSVSANVKALVADAGMLVTAAVEGKLATRADASKHQGDYKKIVEGVNKTLDSVIGPLNVAANYVDRISKGDLPPKITDSYNGDFNEIKNNLNTAIGSINALVADAGMLAQAAVDGKLATRADATKHQGDYRKIVDGVNKTLDMVIGPLNVAANYVDRISKGDLPPKITDAYNGDFNEIKNNLNTAIGSINALVADAGMLAQAAVDGKLATRADASKHQGDYKKIVDGVNKTLDSVIGPLNVAANYVDRISKGDLPPKITDNYNGDFNEIKNNLNTAIGSINALVADAGMLAQAAVDGKLATRADASKHQGDYRKIVEGVNKTLDMVIGPLNVAANYVDRISKGDLPPKITDNYNGDFNEIKNNLNTAIGSINALVADAGMLAQAAVDGKLATRADASKHQGDYRKIVDGVNKTLDMVIGPLNVAANYVDRISKGDLPPKITDNYNGDFNEIKNNLNTAISSINALVADAGMLATAAVEGKLATRADASKHQGDYKKIVDGVNKTLDMVIGPLNVAANYVDRISKGDLPPKITDVYNGDFNEIKNNLNTAIGSINALVVDAGMLAQAGIEGRLATRADATKHQGDYKKIVDGVNKTLDAVIGPLNVAANYVDRISKGDLPPKITDAYNGDFNEIKNNLNQAIGSINALVEDAGLLVQAAVDGKLATRADASKHQGDYKKIVEGVNKTLDAVIGPLNVAANYVDRISKGDLPPKIADTYNGDFNVIKNNLNVAIDSINALVADAGLLVKAAVEGRLETRADASKHQGDYRKIVDGVNKTLDAVIVPLNVAANYVDKISKGNLPPKITDAYNGDFNVIKANLNVAIDSINALVEDAGMLVQAAIEGRLATRADASKHQGDYKKIVDGVNKTLDLVITPVNETVAVLKRLAEGDITLRMTGDYKGDFDILKTALNDSLESFNDTLRQVNIAVDQVAEGSIQVSQASQSLSQGATEQASSLEEITSSVTEIASQTKLNTESAGQVNSLANTAKSNAEQGNAQMQNLVVAMGDINKSAEGIKTIVKAIDDISFQINLLALNANVEAARAGKYGKGFAVVAEEVRNLAVRSANSVKDTTRMVDEAIANIERGNSLCDLTAKQLADIVGGAGQVATLAEEVATASKEQTQGLEQVSTGLNQIDQVTQANTASSEESASASEELSSQSQQVKNMLARFKLKESESKVNNTEVLQMLRSEMAKQGIAHRAPATVGAGQQKQAPGGARKSKAAGLNPADIISLDDENFGKF